MRKQAKIFQALSDTNRIRILKMLESHQLCVCEITEVLKLANSTVSKHLSILREAGFINDEKEGKWVNYQLNHDNPDEYVKKLLPLFKSWLGNDKVILRDKKKIKTVDRNLICGK